jgi:hypothetical protein
MGIHKSFFEGRTPPNVPIESLDNIDWYNEQIAYCFEGREKGGTRITGDHYWFLNMWPIQRVIQDKYGNATNKFEFNYPLWCQDDDYVFKQIEEAQCGPGDKKAIFLFTGRGWGKSYLVVSIGGKIYYLTPRSHSVISASQSDHADETFTKMRECMDGVELLHPTLAHKRLYDSNDYIESGEELTIDGEKRRTGYRSKIEKVLYDKKPGKTKGKRLDFQQWEEAGDFGGAAPLRECIAASEGSWKVGSIYRCRVFYTGTGGTVKSAEARELFENPEAFNIYPVVEWENRKTGIVIPAYRKYGGFYEKDGISDIEGAKAHLMKIREEKKSDPVAYRKFIQEFPFDPNELFQLSGTNNFDQEKLATQYVKIVNDPNYKLGKTGNLHWIINNGKITGVRWEDHKDGKMWKLEDPEKDASGSIYNNLYVGGYDGIDLGTEDTSTGKGSEGALAIKKRFLSGTKSNNVYVFYYHERPKDINEFYENVLKACWYWNLSGKNEDGDITGSLNIEYSKIGIVGFFKSWGKGEMRWLMKRPRLSLSDPTSDKESTKLIGTLPTVKNFENGELFLARYIRDYSEHLFYLPAINQLKDFSQQNRGKFDIAIAMEMAEFADDEYSERLVVKTKKPVTASNCGYYEDENGIMRFGELPNKNHEQMRFSVNEPMPDFINAVYKS